MRRASVLASLIFGLLAPASALAAPHWTPIGPNGPAAPSGLVADPAHHGVVVGIDGRRLVRSTDGGATFQPVPGVPRDPRFMVVGRGANAGLYLLAGPDFGPHWFLYRSRNGGPFARVANGLPATLHVVAVAARGATVAVDAREGLFVSDGAAFDRRSVGFLLNPLAVGFSSLEIDPRDSSHLFLGQTRSIDGGRTWTAVEFQSFGVAIALFSLIDPANPDVHYITTAEGIRWSVDDALTYPQSLGGPAFASTLAKDADGRLLVGGVGIQRLDP